MRGGRGGRGGPGRLRAMLEQRYGYNFAAMHRIGCSRLNTPLAATTTLEDPGTPASWKGPPPGSEASPFTPNSVGQGGGPGSGPYNNTGGPPSNAGFQGPSPFPGSAGSPAGAPPYQGPRPVRLRRNTPLPRRRAVPRPPVPDRRQIPPGSRRPRITPVRRTTGPGPVRSVRRPARPRNSSVDPVPRGRRLYHRVPVIHTFPRMVNRSEDRSTVYHLEVPLDREATLWRDPWVQDIRR
ncbi:proline-rich proteoglycan 2-like [Nylanderia fulva]|uniref:proline-rich proteoglycan 2-like n=1 Tax=Nylanderia fulva TaxID=613905 RepID=UPI0010FB0FEE|nr:proline-rich proteoglycan 2-like [Nylanderia fulva]